MNQQQQLDVIIIVVYLIATALVINQAIQSIETKVVYKLDEGDLNSQLEAKGLKGVINVKFGFDKNYKLLEGPKDLSITVENKSSDRFIEVDWDRSFTNRGGKLGRAIRFTTDKRVELSKTQVFTRVPPGGSIGAKIAGEDMLKYNADTGSLESDQYFVDVAGLKKKAEEPKAKKKERQAYADFIDARSSLSFAMQLAFLVQGGEEGDRFHTVNCNFVVKCIPWTDYLPLKK